MLNEKCRESFSALFIKPKTSAAAYRHRRLARWRFSYRSHDFAAFGSAFRNPARTFFLSTAVPIAFRFAANFRIGLATLETMLFVRTAEMWASLHAVRMERFIFSALNGSRLPPRLMTSFAIVVVIYPDLFIIVPPLSVKGDRRHAARRLDFFDSRVSIVPGQSVLSVWVRRPRAYGNGGKRYWRGGTPLVFGGCSRTRSGHSCLLRGKT